MRIPRILVRSGFDGRSAGDSLQLSDDRAHYLTKVLRLSENAPLYVFDGEGLEYHAHIESCSKKHCIIKLGEQRAGTDGQSPLQTHLGIALSKGDRFDWVLQKATELGVSTITPLMTERVELRLKGERADKKQNHWQGIIESACEQSGRRCLPELRSPVSLNDWLTHNNSELALVLAPDFPGHNADLKALEKPASLSLLIGPEGGLTEAEIAAAIQQGFQAWQLGPRILRTETAPVAALSISQYLWGDLSGSALQPD